MSRASERKRMIEAMAGYSLMSIESFAGLAGLGAEEAEVAVRWGDVPSISVGDSVRVDPIDAYAYVVARRQGLTLAEFEEQVEPLEVARVAREEMLRRGSYEIPPTPARGFVYLILAEEVGRVKIGYATNPRRRLVGLQVGSPVTLTLLRSWPARKVWERRLHDALAAHRLHGEWFDAAAIEAAIVTMEDWTA